MPMKNTSTPAEVMSGHHDGFGISTASSATLTGSGIVPPFFRLMCHQASRASTFGTSAKLKCCGGEGIDHSRVAPFHGSAGALAGPRQVLMMFQMKIRNEVAIISAP